MNTKIFAQRLKEARTTAKMTQADLCKLSGVTAATISAYESSDGTKGKNPSLDNALKLAQALNVSLDWLCGSIVSNSKIQITDFIKILVQLDKNIKMSFDIVDLLDYETSKILPNSVNSVTNEEYVENALAYEQSEEEEVYEMGVAMFHNVYIDKFIRDWQKVRMLYKNKTIDENLYNLWLDKQYQEIDENQRNNEQYK